VFCSSLPCVCLTVRGREGERRWEGKERRKRGCGFGCCNGWNREDGRKKKREDGERDGEARSVKKRRGEVGAGCVSDRRKKEEEEEKRKGERREVLSGGERGRKREKEKSV
jgi:hypothetical protein